MIVGPEIGPLYDQRSVLVCKATNINDMHFSIVKDFWICVIYATAESTV